MNFILQKCFIFFMNFPKVAMKDENIFCSNLFSWHDFLSCHKSPLSWGLLQKMQIPSPFSIIVVRLMIGKIISSRFRKKFETGSENSPKKIHRSAQTQRFICMCMTGNSQFRRVFPLVKQVSVHFLGMLFSKLCILAFYLKFFIYPRLNIPISKRIMKIVHFTSNY